MTNPANLILPAIDLLFARLLKKRLMVIELPGPYELDGLIQIKHPRVGLMFLSIRSHGNLLEIYLAERRKEPRPNDPNLQTQKQDVEEIKQAPERWLYEALKRNATASAKKESGSL